MYLKLNVKSEPLIWKWYAWPYLIPPIQAGCNIVERHLKIMKSYIQFPKIHENAVKNPEMLGGPFMDLDNRYMSHVQDLIKYTEDDCKTYIELQNDYKKFQRQLNNDAIGNSLEPMYEQSPNSLHGLFELVYNMNNSPQINLIEKLIYERYYTDKGQSISLSLTVCDRRSFVLSTPRVKNEDEVNIKIPYESEIWDELFKSKFQDININELFVKLGIKDDKIRLFKSFFTEEKPARPDDRNYRGDAVRIRYFGHASILIQTSNISILTDPVISYDLSDDRFTYKDLPDVIDYLLITHNHQDHVMFETLLQIRYKVKNIIVPRNNKGALEDPSLKLILQKIGFKNVIEIDNLDSISIPEGKIMGIPFLGEHSDLNIHTKTAYFLDVKHKKFLLAADSNNISPKMYEYLFELTGKIDILFLGMECDGAPLSWLYGPLLSNPLKRSFDKQRQLSGSNFEKAWNLAKESGCKGAYVYAMGMEPWLTYIMALQYADDSIQITESDKFIKKCLDNNISAERLFMKKEWIA